MKILNFLSWLVRDSPFHLGMVIFCLVYSATFPKEDRNIALLFFGVVAVVYLSLKYRYYKKNAT